MAKSIVTLRASLEAKNYRDIAISGDASLYTLAGVITQVYGFDFDHAFGFYDNIKDIYKAKTVYELFKDMGEPSVDHARSVQKSRVTDAFDRDGKVFAFLFDYGDDWMFKVERTSLDEREAPKAFWKLLKSVGEAPEQYPSYEEDDDDRPFDDKYEIKKVGDLTVATRKPKA